MTGYDRPSPEQPGYEEHKYDQPSQEQSKQERIERIERIEMSADAVF